MNTTTGLLLLLLVGVVAAAPTAPVMAGDSDTAAEGVRTVRVFIALCDNKTQGIAPVGEKIGNGDDADANLYWGCDDGFARQFKRSGRWKEIDSHADDSGEDVVRRLRMRHVDGDLEILAEAYRGSRLRECLRDFEAAAASGRHAVVAFIGHNGLMDFTLPETDPREGTATEAIVLCCRSDAWFRERLSRLGCRPILTTTQLMYPGSFILHDALEAWKKGGAPSEIRAAAGRAYARNQNIPVRAATGVFADHPTAESSSTEP